MSSIPTIFLPGANDVVLGSGRTYESHVRNKHFAKVLKSLLHQYAAASKIQKSMMIVEIMQYFKSKSSTGGFVHQDFKTGKFIPVSDHYIREKISQAFRDLLDNHYKSSKKSRKQIRLASSSLKTQHCGIEMNNGPTSHTTLHADRKLGDRFESLPTSEQKDCLKWNGGLCLVNPLVPLHRECNGMENDRENGKKVPSLMNAPRMNIMNQKTQLEDVMKSIQNAPSKSLFDFATRSCFVPQPDYKQHGDLLLGYCNTRLPQDSSFRPTRRESINLNELDPLPLDCANSIRDFSKSWL